jgi:hypothetical protein
MIILFLACIQVIKTQRMDALFMLRYHLAQYRPENNLFFVG